MNNNPREPRGRGRTERTPIAHHRPVRNAAARARDLTHAVHAYEDRVGDSTSDSDPDADANADADAAGKHGNLNPFLDFLLGEGHSVTGAVFVFKYSRDAYSDGPYAHEDPDSAPTIIYHNGPVPPSPSVPPRKSLRLSEKAGVTPLTLTTLEPCEDSMARLYGCF